MSKYIDIEWLKKKKRFDSKQQRHIVRMTDIYSAPTIEIVRCRECRWYNEREGCLFSTAEITADDFCSYGERKESE